MAGNVFGFVAIGSVAFWSVLSNFLCTFIMVALKPFHLGDELANSNVHGRVIDLRVVYSTSEDGPSETVIVPNNLFFQTFFRRRAGLTAADLKKHLRFASPRGTATNKPHRRASP